MTSWPTKKLGDIAEVGAGNSAPQEKRHFLNGTIPFFRTSDVGKVHLSNDLNTVEDFLNEGAINKLKIKIYPKHTILFPKSGASTFLNHRVMIGTKGAVSSHLATIITVGKVLQSFLFYFLLQIDAKKLTADQNYPSLRISDIQNIQVPFPPLEIQKQIVERLDKIAEAQKLNDELIQKTDELFNSLLHKELDHTSKNWEVKKLGELIETQYGYTASAKDKGNYRFVRITDIDDDGNLKQNDKKYVSLSLKEIKDYILDKEDLLLARIGSIGKILYFCDDEPSIFASYLIRLSPDKLKIIPQYLWLFSRTPDYWRQVELFAAGAVQPQFNANRIKQIKIPLPPLKIQQKIVEKLSAIQEYKKKLLDQKTLLKELFESVLNKSFKAGPVRCEEK
jgi:restriction endonuclease S subunit